MKPDTEPRVLVSCPDCEWRYCGGKWAAAAQSAKHRSGHVARNAALRARNGWRSL